MKDNTRHVFYSSKPRVVHIAVNIAVAPILLYLLGIWPWPPTVPHYLTFLITGLIGFRYAKQRIGRPRLVLDDQGLHFDRLYPTESIRGAQRVLRAVKLTLIQDDGQVQEKVINLGWASNNDFPVIVKLLTERFGKAA